MANSPAPSTPLRDRLLSNSPTADGHGWIQQQSTSSSHSGAVSPLRIAKRDTPTRKLYPTQLARRSSSSYAHVRNNNLVSKSPFRSNVPTSVKPTPTQPIILTPTRRISGEKRPRPSSLSEQAENEYPMGFKRRQSKGFQGLVQKEPVTNSPFRRAPQSGDSPPPPPVPPKLSHLPAISPSRPSLVTKRFHGPRTVPINFANVKRPRRKTVTFDERCDVVEFDRDEDEDLMDEDQYMQGYGQEGAEEGDEDEEARVDEDGLDQSLDHVQNPDDSITGLVNSMLQDAQGDDRPHTPPQVSPLPVDLEIEDGIPLDRLGAYHEEYLQYDNDGERMPPTERSYIWSSSSSSPATPPGSRARSPSTGILPGSHPPFGCTTDAERAEAVRRFDELDRDLQMLPPSPSPSKKTPKRESHYSDGLIPTFSLQVKGDSVASTGADPFELTPAKIEHGAPNPSTQEDSDSYYGSESVNRSIELPEVQVPSLETIIEGSEERPNVSSGLVVELSSPGASQSTSATSSKKRGSDVGSRSNSPLSRSASPFFTIHNSSTSSVDSRGSLTRSRGPRISKEDVQQRLMKKRSMDSPLREVVSSNAEFMHHENPAVENTDCSEQMETDGAPLNNMFSRKSSVEALQSSADVSADVEPKDVAIETVEKKRIISLKTEDNRTHDGLVSFDRNSAPLLPELEQPAHTLGAFEGLKFDLESDTGFGPMEMDHLDDMRSALDRLVQDVADSRSASSGRPSLDQRLLKIEAVTEGVKAGTFKPPSTLVDEDMITDEEPEEQETKQSASAIGKKPIRASTADSVLMATGFAVVGTSVDANDAPPPPPPKDAIKTREKMIMDKRREVRRQEEEEALGFVTPPRKTGRPRRRRSLSTGDAEDLLSKKSSAARKRVIVLKREIEEGSLDVAPFVATEDPLSDSIDRELRKLEGPNRGKYHVREHETTIYASSDADRVSHMAGAGDLNSGKAWRPVRRPSDMNEHSKQIKEYQSQERPVKTHGKVFVRVIRMTGIIAPLPPQPTAVTCTLNNGIHFVTTPECRLGRDCSIDQEFELIEHSKLEFTLTFKIKRDPHIIAQFKANSSPAPVPPRQVTPPPLPKAGRFNFFGSPKKPAKSSPRLPPSPSPPVHRLDENLARYLKQDGTLARAFISFKDLASHCDTRLFETTYPLIGQRLEEGNTVKTQQVGEMVIQMFRLPPLPGVPPQQLPQSLEECHRGLRHVSWHKVTYFEGTLTQNGGDCTTWRRRHLRIIGANLVAYNDVTKKAIATIDLKKALAVEDDQEPRRGVSNSASDLTTSGRYSDEFDGPYGVERSFRLLFPDDQQILFFADSDEEKSRWLEILRALIGHIPPNPLWAELLWQRQEELAKQGSRTSTSVPRSLQPRTNLQAVTRQHQRT